MRTRLIILFLFAGISFLVAQNQPRIDSLKNILQTLPELNGSDADTLRMRISLDIGDLFLRSKPDSAMLYYKSIFEPNIFEDQDALLLAIPENIYKYRLIASSLYIMGTIHYNKRDYNEAQSNWLKALLLNNKIGNQKMISTCLNALGVIAKDTGNFPLAINYFRESIGIKEEINDWIGVSYGLINLGSIARTQGDYEYAYQCFAQSLEIGEELDHKPTIAGCLNNLGLLSERKGDLTKAVIFYEKVLLLAEELNNKVAISSSLANLGNVSQEQGNYLRALEYFERSLEIDVSISDRKGIAVSYRNIGITYKFQGEYEKAEEYFLKSLDLSKEIGDKQGLAQSIGNLGNIALSLNNLNNANSFYLDALQIFEELGSKRDIALVYTNLGHISGRLKRFDKTLDYYEKSLKINETLGDNKNLASSYSYTGNTHLKLSSPEKAYPLFLKSRDITLYMLQDNFSILTEKEKENYLNTSKDIFNKIHSFNALYGNQFNELSGICYNNELIIKGLLLKSTQAILDVVNNNPDPEIREAYLTFTQLRNKISELQSKSVDGSTEEIEKLEKQANEQERRLVRLSSEFADLHNLFNYNWEDVKKALRPNEAAIEFVSFEKSEDDSLTTIYAALLITPTCNQPISVQLFNDVEMESILGSSTETGFRYVETIYGTNKPANKALYQLIWQPLEDKLSGINTVYYAPVGVLNKVSFAALAVDTVKLLSDAYNLQQVSSTSSLIDRKLSMLHPNIKAAIYGGIAYSAEDTEDYWQYLPGTLTEKKKIENHLVKHNIDVATFTGEQAKEENFKIIFGDNQNQYGIIHIATHGFFYPDPDKRDKLKSSDLEVETDDVTFRGSRGFGYWMFVNSKNPMMRSGLVFAGANRVWSEEWGKTDNDGVLTAYEVAQLKMRNTQLVVLSACETGLGDIRGSEGVYGLQRAFKMAGAKYIIMSLWQVPDKETVEFMEIFYAKLLKSKDIRNSFTQTQREMRKKYDPYYWAAFVLVE